MAEKDTKAKPRGGEKRGGYSGSGDGTPKVPQNLGPGAGTPKKGEGTKKT